MNKILFIKIVFFVTICWFANSLQAQTFYDPNTIETIEINFSQTNWDYRMDTAKLGSDGYLMAEWVKINGVQFDSVGVQYKGNSSFDSAQVKNPFHINLSKFKNQNFQGYQDLKLSNGYGDPSCIREVLSYDILRNYMHCPKSNFAKIFVNGKYIGLYSNDENIDKKFIADHFYSSNNTFVKCSSPLSPSAAQKNSFKYISADSTAYMDIYDLKSDIGWNDLVNLCNVVTNTPNNVTEIIDIDRVIWMLAFNNLFVNLDSYSGVYSQNHYVYKDHTNHFNPMVWDLNMSFGSFPYAGFGTIGLGQKSLLELKQLSPYLHETETAWPLINKVLSDTSLRRKYLAHFKTMLNENFVSGDYQTKATQYQTLIDNAIATDSNKFFTYAQFQAGMTIDVVFGSFTVPGIGNIMEARKTYLNNLPEFLASEPSISNPVFSNNAPTINSNINLSVAISNSYASSVYLGYRYDIREKFIKLPLFDDGLHNDGASNDGTFGNQFIMTGAKMQYYIYGENSNIGKFLPARAEHEFLTLHAASSLPSIGDLVINEILADNVGGQKDEYNDTEDWIELYNNSNNVLDLSNVYLSNNLLNTLKWKMPNGTTIMPKGYLTIWADDDSLEQILHTNFNINKDSGIVILSNASSLLLDSISFSTQATNVSYGRYPNGTGGFITMGTTYGFENNNFPLLINNTAHLNNPFIIYPNPAHNVLNLNRNNDGKNETCSLEIFNTLGQLVIKQTIPSNMVHFSLDISSLKQGMYYLKIATQAQKLIVE